MYDEPKGFGVVLAYLYEASERGLLGINSNGFRYIMVYDPKSLEEILII